jgi:hypothetical protein
MTAHESQGSSIPYVFANSQRLHGKRSFYVAYSRASVQLSVCNKIGKTKGVAVSGSTWTNTKLGLTLQLSSELVYEASAVVEAIKNQFAGTDTPSTSHIACVLNPSHASKSAKGWKLV